MRVLVWILTILSAIFLLTADVAPVQAMSSKRPYAPCTDPARIKVGGKIFYLSRSGRVILTYVEAPRKKEDLCHNILEASDWTAKVYLDLLLDGIENETSDRNIPLVQYIQRLHVFVTSSQDERPMHEDVQELLKLLNVKMNDLPVEHGFRVWRRKDRVEGVNPRRQKGEHFENFPLTGSMQDLHARHNIYISDDPDLLSPIGERAIIACLAYVPESDCRVRIWDGDVFFEVGGMGPGLIPKKRWKEFYKNVLKLRASLLIEPAAKSPP